MYTCEDFKHPELYARVFALKAQADHITDETEAEHLWEEITNLEASMIEKCTLPPSETKS